MVVVESGSDSSQCLGRGTGQLAIITDEGNVAAVSNMVNEAMVSLTMLEATEYTLAE